MAGVVVAMTPAIGALCYWARWHRGQAGQLDRLGLEVARRIRVIQGPRSYLSCIPTSSLLSLICLAILTPDLALRAQGDDASLTMTELWAVELPIAAPVHGAIVVSDTMLVFWGKRAAMLATPLTRSRICPYAIHTPVAAAAVVRNGRTEVEVLNSDASIAVATAPEIHSPCPITRHAPPKDSLIGAAHVGGQWLLAEREAGQLYVRAVGSNTRTAVRAGSSLAIAWNGVVHVSQAAQGILVTQRQWPFTWVVLQQDGSVSVTSGPFETRLDAESTEAPRPLADPAFRSWLSLPTLDIGEGFVQTLADPRSDGRLLIRYGESGYLLAARRLDIPFGLLASHQSKPLVLALRTTDRQELVTYGWRRNTTPSFRR